jgi:nucleotidyltransferase substrate binding protein (TIGR01987 family)
MDKIDTTYIERCIQTLEKSYMLLNNANPEEIYFDIYRSACVKEFEIILEQCGKLLRKCLKPYFHSSSAVDRLYFKEVFKQAVLKGIISDDVCERFLGYRDNRNSTAHDYGVNFAEETLQLIPGFIEDARMIVHAINKQNDATS